MRKTVGFALAPLFLSGVALAQTAETPPEVTEVTTPGATMLETPGDMALVSDHTAFLPQSVHVEGGYIVAEVPKAAFPADADENDIVSIDINARDMTFGGDLPSQPITLEIPYARFMEGDDSTVFGPARFPMEPLGLGHLRGVNGSVRADSEFIRDGWPVGGIEGFPVRARTVIPVREAPAPRDSSFAAMMVEDAPAMTTDPGLGGDTELDVHTAHAAPPAVMIADVDQPAAAPTACPHACRDATDCGSCKRPHPITTMIVPVRGINFRPAVTNLYWGNDGYLCAPGPVHSFGGSNSGYGGGGCW